MTKNAVILVSGLTRLFDRVEGGSDISSTFGCMMEVPCPKYHSQHSVPIEQHTNDDPLLIDRGRVPETRSLSRRDLGDYRIQRSTPNVTALTNIATASTAGSDETNRFGVGGRTHSGYR